MIDVQRYARITGILFLLSIVAGFFGEFYVPSTIVVPGDAAATAKNVADFNSMFRFGFAMYLVEAVCDIALAWILYVLLRPVRKDLALLAAFFGLVSTAVFAGAELFFFAPTFILGNAALLEAFSPDQVRSLGLLSFRLYGYGAGIFMVFYGIATLIRGYLIYRSDYLPRALGILLMIAGMGFVIRNFVLVMAPAYASDAFVFPMFLAAVAMTLWLLTKGIDKAKWEAVRSAAAET